MKNVAVLFSGGIDSTYLVWKNLKDGNHVTPYYIEITNNEKKTILEKNRINHLIREFKNEFGYDKIKDICVGLEITINKFDGFKYVQMPIWLLGIQYFQDNYIDEFQIGYVCGDDMISYIDDIKNIIKSYNPIKFKETIIEFPIIKTHKRDIYSELPKKYLDLTITCENPQISDEDYFEYTDDKFYSKVLPYKPCGDCDPCKKIISYDLISYYGNLYENVVNEKLLKYIRWNGYSFSENFKNDLQNTVNSLFLKNEKPQYFEGYQLELPFKYDSDNILCCSDYKQFKTK